MQKNWIKQTILLQHRKIPILASAQPWKTCLLEAKIVTMFLWLNLGWRRFLRKLRMSKIYCATMPKSQDVSDGWGSDVHRSLRFVLCFRSWVSDVFVPAWIQFKAVVGSLSRVTNSVTDCWKPVESWASHTNVFWAERSRVIVYDELTISRWLSKNWQLCWLSISPQRFALGADFELEGLSHSPALRLYCQPALNPQAESVVCWSIRR